MVFSLSNIIEKKVDESLAGIQSYLSQNNISSFRLLNQSYAVPLNVDIYHDNAVIHVFSRIEPVLFIELQQVLKSRLKINDFFFKNRSKEDLNLPPGRPKKIVVEEYGHKFLVNLSDYLDTGLFLDHRETRRWLAGLSPANTVLNTFAYTGSFSVYAAANGALKTFSVDISRVYCEWTKQNLELNSLSLESNWVYKMDALEFFQYAKRKSLAFDIIIIDPPTFSKNKGRSFSVQKDHPALVNNALELLTPSGFILFSTNYQEFMMNAREIKSARLQEKRDTIPPDFAGTQPHRCFIISK